MFGLDLCVGFVVSVVLACLAGWAGAFPFAREGRTRRGAYLSLASCALVAAVGLDGAQAVAARNRAAADFLPIEAHPKGWRYELHTAYEFTPAGMVEVPNPEGIRRNLLHDQVRAFAPLLVVLYLAIAWTFALTAHPRTPWVARAGALFVLAALVRCLSIVHPLDLPAALSGD